jgi:putative transposase
MFLPQVDAPFKFASIAFMDKEIVAMRQKKAKSSTKKKKAFKDSGIRRDIWTLELSSTEKQLAIMIVSEYRDFLKPLVLIAYWNWERLSQLKANEKVNTLEKLIHKTEDNPHPKYARYFEKAIDNHPSFRKFPSYLRRAAIQDALAIVSSFVTRWELWKRGERKHRHDAPPKLTSMCRSYPALYKGQQIRYNVDFNSIDLKVWSGSDWIWLSNIKVKSHGKNRHKVPGHEIQSPALIANRNKVQLSMPVKIEVNKLPKSDYVCAVDIGINNSATVSIVGKNGTVKARKFINPARDIDRRDQRRMQIKRKSRLTMLVTQQNLRKYFCKGLYRKSSNINEQIAQTVSQQILDFSKPYNVSVIVFEDLSNWKAKSGKKGTLHKQKFHQWCKDRTVTLTIYNFSEFGGTVEKIHAKYTSAFAFDGSGKVKRGKKDYSQATFQNSKRDNADLSASYNIGARYWYAVLTNSKFTKVWEGKSSSHSPRTPVTLASLWGFAKAS